MEEGREDADRLTHTRYKRTAPCGGQDLSGKPFTQVISTTTTKGLWWGGSDEEAR